MAHSLTGKAPAPPASGRSRRSLPPLAPNASLRWDVVSRLLPEEPGVVLEIGCGRGAAAARIARTAKRMVCCEPDAQSFATAHETIGEVATLHNCMSFELPASETFDTICAFEVLEHIEDDAAALAEWCERLRPGGTMIVSVPAWQHRLGLFDRMVGHYRRYDPEHIRVCLEQAGLRDVHVELFGFPFGYLLENFRNLLARRMAKHETGQSDFAVRTASSGRLMQPDKGLMGLIVLMVSRPMVWTQRLFPNRGVGLVARARRP